MKAFVLVAGILSALSVTLIGLTRDWDLISRKYLNKHSINQLGYFGHFAHETLDSLRRMVSDKSLSGVEIDIYKDFLRTRSKTIEEQRSKIVNKKNVIYIQLESIDGLCIGGALGDRSVMPFLHNMASDSIYFKNTMDNSMHGRSTDGEFMALTSLPPLRKEVVYTLYDLSKVPSLPRTLSYAGYHCVSIHGFDGHFWNRENVHEALGFDQSYFIDDLDKTDSVGWGIADCSLLQQAKEVMQSLPEPFFLHIILLTNHHPYDHLRDRLGRGEQSIVSDYMDSIGYVDECLRTFFDGGSESPKFKRSLIALFGDHDSGISGLLENALEFTESRPVLDSVPFLIVGSDRAPTTVQKLVSLSDLPVIVLNELGLASPHTFTGSPLLSDSANLHPTKGAMRLDANNQLANADLAIDTDMLSKLAIMHSDRLTNANR